MPLPEQIAVELEAIDAALAGEAVDPGFAELAELALLLADGRPEPSLSTVTALDRRVSSLALGWDAAKRPTRPLRLRPAWGAGLAVCVALAVAVLVVPGGGSSSSGLSTHSVALRAKAATSGPEQPSHGENLNSTLPSSSASSGPYAAATSTSASGAASLSNLGPVTARAGAAGSTAGASSTLDSQQQNLQTKLVPALSPLSAAPVTNGRKTIQSDNLTLTAPAARLGTVSQELFDVVGAQQGIVEHSQVSTGSGGFASFTLSIPTGNLPATLAALARLKYANVASSTASTTDVNSQYLNDQRALADAKALRLSLLKQLQAASSTAAIDSLDQQIQTAEQTIDGDEATLNGLDAKISYSSVDVQIDPGNAPHPGPVRHSSGFTLARAVHDAGRVLVVIAGVGLITLAVLVPLALVGALIAWSVLGVRRRSRERALDAA